MNLEEYLYHHIPLSQAMGIKVVEASAASATILVPLAPNINHKQTAFGGSLHAAAALACWIYLYNRLEGAPQTQIVIAKSTAEYKAPVTANFLMTCLAPDETAWQRFLKMYQAKGKGRITLCAETPGFCFQGEFALLSSKLSREAAVACSPRRKPGVMFNQNNEAVNTATEKI